MSYKDPKRPIGSSTSHNKRTMPDVDGGAGIPAKAGQRGPKVTLFQQRQPSTGHHIPGGGSMVAEEMGESGSVRDEREDASQSSLKGQGRNVRYRIGKKLAP